MIHLRPTAELAPRVLLPGDPGRALLLAGELLQRPKMFNHHRGLWGYTGRATDGELLTIQSTGMGGPSAAIVVSELADLGARTVLRTGTCGALDPALELGELLIANRAMCADGTSRALGAGDWMAPAGELCQALAAAAGEQARCAQIVSTDLFYEQRSDEDQRWAQAGACAVDMESATLFALCARRGLAAASVLIVTDVLSPDRRRIEDEALRSAERRMGHLALAALSEVRADMRRSSQQSSPPPPPKAG